MRYQADFVILLVLIGVLGPGMDSFSASLGERTTKVSAERARHTQAIKTRCVNQLRNRRIPTSALAAVGETGENPCQNVDTVLPNTKCRTSTNIKSCVAPCEFASGVKISCSC